MTTPLLPQYWAVHFTGIDQVVAMIGFAEATEWAADANREWTRQMEMRGLSTPPVEAYVISSPWSGEEHFRQCARALHHFLKDGAALMTDLQVTVAASNADADRYRFHRAVTTNPELFALLEPLMGFLDEVPEPTTDEEMDALIDKAMGIARAHALWPVAPAAHAAQPEAVEVAA